MADKTTQAQPDVDEIIKSLLSVKGSKPGKTVTLPEKEILFVL